MFHLRSPYRTRFQNPATNIEPSLLGNSFSDPAYIIDLEEAALIFLTLAFVSALIRRSVATATAGFAPATFGGGVWW